MCTKSVTNAPLSNIAVVEARQVYHPGIYVAYMNMNTCFINMILNVSYSMKQTSLNGGFMKLAGACRGTLHSISINKSRSLKQHPRSVLENPGSQVAQMLTWQLTLFEPFLLIMAAYLP